MEILLSISCTTYNHESFLKKCLDGFLEQKCDFLFEVLIHDDASTDGTISIIREYSEKYPKIFKPYFQKTNQWSKGVRGMNAKYNFSRAKGRYIAMCEGDDYWTDPLKLQKQVDLLEENSNFIACFTNALVINEILNKSYIYKKYEKKEFTIQDFISSGAFFPTASLVFRNIFSDSPYPDFLYKAESGDRGLSLALASKGNFCLLDEVTCVYRRHENGVFSSNLNNWKRRLEIDKSNIKLLQNFDSYTNREHAGKIKEAISNRAYRALSRNGVGVFNPDKRSLFRYLHVKDWFRLLWSMRRK